LLEAGVDAKNAIADFPAAALAARPFPQDAGRARQAPRHVSSPWRATEQRIREMVAIPLAHISWAIADNADRKACDQFFIDTFGAEIAYEMLVTPENAVMGLDREESLMMIGDTMIIPIAPAGAGASRARRSVTCSAAAPRQGAGWASRSRRPI
jgi:hypothetical protein